MKKEGGGYKGKGDSILVTEEGKGDHTEYKIKTLKTKHHHNPPQNNHTKHIKNPNQIKRPHPKTEPATKNRTQQKPPKTTKQDSSTQ